MPEEARTTSLLNQFMTAPSPPARAVVACVCVALLVPLTWLFLKNGAFPDYISFHEASRVWRAGGNPYDGGYPDPLFYPLPSVILVAPLSSLPMPVAGAIFMGLGVGLLAYGITRESWFGLTVFLSANMVIALGLGQWTLLLTAAVLLPWLSPLLVLKPSLGLALAAGYPSWGALVGGPLLLVLSLALMPTWPAEWLANVRDLHQHVPPVLLPGGALVLLAATRWRRPEARLLVAMACVPQLMFFADQLPLWLVARTNGERGALLATGLLGLVGVLVADRAAFSSATFVLLSCYLPALVIVLRRPNEGRLPAWLERRVARAPAWLRGRAGAAV